MMRARLQRLARRRFLRASLRRRLHAAMIEIAAGDTQTADPAGGRNGSAPEGTSGASAASALIPANAGPPQKRPARAEGLRHAQFVDVGPGGETNVEAPSEFVSAILGPVSSAMRPARFPEKLDLAAAPSSMEAVAELWRDGEIPPHARPPAIDDGKAWCGPCDARVPAWFGKDCIAGQCPLKTQARAAA